MKWRLMKNRSVKYDLFNETENIHDIEADEESFCIWNDMLKIELKNRANFDLVEFRDENRFWPSISEKWGRFWNRDSKISELDFEMKSRVFQSLSKSAK